MGIVFFPILGIDTNSERVLAEGLGAKSETSEKRTAHIYQKRKASTKIMSKAA